MNKTLNTELLYKNGKIFCIEPEHVHSIDDCYYGVTNRPLDLEILWINNSYQLWKNGYTDSYCDLWKNGYINHKVSVFELFNKYGIDNCKITLFKSFPCETKDELEVEVKRIIKHMAFVNNQINQIDFIINDRTLFNTLIATDAAYYTTYYRLESKH
jgi:hypothetical protein